MVINQGPRDVAGTKIYYELDDVRQRIERYFGSAVRWATIGPLVREQVQAVAPSFPLVPTDWHNIIDVDHWWIDRRAPVGDVPVIGRHGRPEPLKWPRTAEEILQAYPPQREFKVRVLGGGEFAVDRLGALPESWEVLPFGSIHPRTFLSTIDYFVYFHDANLVEAFGRTILEAMASGVPVIVPKVFRVLFKDAALYATPDQVQSIVRSLHAEWDSYREVSSRARAFVEERFGYGSHVARLRELGVISPRALDSSTARVRSLPRQDTATSLVDLDQKEWSRVMMLSSNGAGLGHLTRLMAIARRLRKGIQTIVATQSHAAPLVQQSGYLTEYIPSRNYLDIPANTWNEFLHDRLLHLVTTHGPRVVVVDGTVPYNGLLRTINDHPEITWIWVRRAMWKRGQGGQWIERGQAFDYVLEPGEFAAAADEGPTVAERSTVRAVGPIIYLDPSELMDRESARSVLGLDERPAALLQLGAGNINDISSPVARISQCLIDHGFQVVFAQSPIATRQLHAPSGAQIASLYPLSEYLRAFDLALSATGYNSYHELIASCVPSVFVPNSETALDDQIGRARYAAEMGVGLAIYDPTSSEVEEILDQAVRPDVRARLAQRCSELAIVNGAPDAAAWIGSLCPDRSYA